MDSMEIQVLAILTGLYAVLKHQNTKYVRQPRGHLIIFVSNLVLNLSKDIKTFADLEIFLLNC